MYMSVDAYFKRIKAALERVIAPAVEDDKTRGQVFAIVNLLDQLGTRIEYKPALIKEDVERNTRTAREVADRISAIGGAVPEELSKMLADLAEIKSWDMSARDRSEEALSRAIELFFSNQHLFSRDEAMEVDQLIRDHLTGTATRDIGLTKPPDFDKISGSRSDQHRHKEKDTK